MQAWNYEADQIRTDELLNKKDIVSNQAIDEFLSSKKDHNKFFLVAPKGLGKTLILKVKSKSNRDSCSEMNCVFIPKTELVEKIQITPISISYEKFEIFTRLSTWLQIWDICLTLTICKHFNYRIPETFEKILNDSISVSDVLNTILLDWKFFISQNISQYQSEIAPILRNVEQHTFLYLDSLDQAIGQIIQGYIENNPDERKNQQLIDLWSNSQLGLLYSISAICQKNRFIKIYASIRQEAFEMDISDLHLQIEDFTTIVKYSKKQLEQIFIFNIERTEKSKLVSPGDSNPYIRFVGFARMPHIFVINKDEDFFEFIYRHTFGRPRELVRMGNLIYNSSPEDRTIINLREKINTLSYNNIFEQFKREVIPFFDENKLRQFLSTCKCNIFSKDEVKSMNKDLLRFYYKLGLIGIIKRNAAQTGYIQEFREAFKFNYKKTIQLPDSQYFVTHPAMDDLITTQLNKNYHSLNIIGFNYPFTIPKKKKVKTLQCCHFGVGNLGTGLVLPYLLKTGCKLILINRLSDRWKETAENNIKEVIFNDSNSNEIKFFLLHDLLSKEDVES